MVSCRRPFSCPLVIMFLIVVPSGSDWFVSLHLQPQMRLTCRRCSGVLLLMRHALHIITETFCWKFFLMWVLVCCNLIQGQCLRLIMQRVRLWWIEKMECNYTWLCPVLLSELTFGDFSDYVITVHQINTWGLVPAQYFHFFYTRYHLSALQSCELIFSANFQFIFTFK